MILLQYSITFCLLIKMRQKKELQLMQDKKIKIGNVILNLKFSMFTVIKYVS